MSLFSELKQKPATLALASKYTIANGVFYIGTGALLLFWPGVIQAIFLDVEFVGHEAGLMRLVGMTLLVIGWLYIFGGRTGGRQMVAATVVDRLIFVPLVLIPLAMAGVFPHLCFTFAVVDPALGLGAWLLLRRPSEA